MKADINAAANLKGKKVASPQLGGTQDVALRYRLERRPSLKTDPPGQRRRVDHPGRTLERSEHLGSDAIRATPGCTEPWAHGLVRGRRGKVLVNGANLWPGHQFVDASRHCAPKFFQNIQVRSAALL